MKHRIECPDCTGTYDGTESGWRRHFFTKKHQRVIAAILAKRS